MTAIDDLRAAAADLANKLTECQHLAEDFETAVAECQVVESMGQYTGMLNEALIAELEDLSYDSSYLCQETGILLDIADRSQATAYAIAALA